jgi:hypothetical protein
LHPAQYPKKASRKIATRKINIKVFAAKTKLKSVSKNITPENKNPSKAENLLGAQSSFFPVFSCKIFIRV